MTDDGGRSMEENQAQKNNSFVREKIKEKPFNKKRALVRILVSALCGIVFAAMACLVFVIMLPRMQQLMETHSTESTGIASQESETGQTETAEPDTETGTEEPTEDDTGTETETTETDEPDSEGDEQNEPDASDYELTLSDYQKLQDELYSIGENVNASVVTITSVVSDTDLFHNEYDAEDLGSGVIISENEDEYLILTERKVIKNASRISVTFLDDTVCDAVVKKEDNNMGLAVLGVAKADVGVEKTVATIGNSLTVRGGMIAIALGSPLGTNYSILTGNITSTNNEVSVDDHNYTIFTTDIVASKDGSGILINVDGEIIGIVMQDYSISQAENTLTAISASELQAVIDKLCLGEDIPYMGVRVSTVTSKIESAYGIPKGVYIREVAMDSPAMNAGLQSGDIITKINGEEIRTDRAFSNALLALSAGDEVKVEVERKGATDYTAIKYEVTLGVLNEK
jgi:serine protease Do